MAFVSRVYIALLLLCFYDKKCPGSVSSSYLTSLFYVTYTVDYNFFDYMAYVIFKVPPNPHNSMILCVSTDNYKLTLECTWLVKFLCNSAEKLLLLKNHSGNQSACFNSPVTVLYLEPLCFGYLLIQTLQPVFWMSAGVHVIMNLE